MELKHKELGSLTQIADALWDEMLKEIDRNGYSDLTLVMEGSVRGIHEIIEINGIKERAEGERVIDAINEAYK